MTSRAERGAVAEAHPFTPLVATLAVVLLAFLLPAPIGPVVLALVVAAATLALGDPGVWRPTFIIVLPLWALLVLMLGILGDAPFTRVGPLHLSIQGLRETLAQGCRLTAIVLASLLTLRGFRAARFVDAAAERGWPFAAAYLVAATMQTIPRLRQRVLLIRDAQRARGLRVRGSLATRAAALIPLTLPLILGALADADSRAIALETRAIAALHLPGRRRTPLAPPDDRPLDRAIRWGSVLAVVAAALWRFAR